MKPIHILLIVILIAILTGCATTPVGKAKYDLNVMDAPGTVYALDTPDPKIGRAHV